MKRLRSNPNVFLMLLGLGALALTACKDPVAPIMAACNDDYHPAMCDGEEVCETDSDGCRSCVCERDEKEEPKE